MQKLMDKLNLEKISALLIVVSMILLPASEFVCSLFAKHFYFQEDIVILFGSLSCICVLLQALKRKKIQFYKSDILIALLFFFAVLSLIFTKDMNQSLYGNKPSYREGILVFFSYYSVALLASRVVRTEYRKLILKTFLGIAIVETVVGILQFSALWPYPPLFDGEVDVGQSSFLVQNWAFGFTEHFNFFAALMVVFTGLTAGLYLTTEGKMRKFYLFLTGFCFFGVMTTYTRIGWLGTFGFICYLLVLCLVAHKMKITRNPLAVNRILLLFGIYVSIFVISVLVLPELRYNVFETNNEIKSKNVNKLGNHRMWIWKEGLQTVPQYWYVGTGLDNYVYSFFWDNPDYKGWYQDKGHNEYIHILVTQGVFALTTQLTLIVYNLVTSAKRFLHLREDDEEGKITFILIVMYAGYLCQALANSSVTNVAIYNWIITGLLLYVADKKALKTIAIK